MEKTFKQFFGLILLAIVATYFMPNIVLNLFFLGTAYAYFKSKDEPFWLAFFLVVSDGFFGFFDNFEALVSIIPGLPAIEVGQLYIVISIIKAWGIEKPNRTFYITTMQILFIYLIFLVVQGQVLGLDTKINIQFRIVKLLLPLFLFFSIPRLMDTQQKYLEFFKYIFPVAIGSLVAQIFTIAVQAPPTKFFGLGEKIYGVVFDAVSSEEVTYRGSYNDSISIIGTFGALYYLSLRDKPFKSIYLYAVMISNLLMHFLSATRGWFFGLLIAVFLCTFLVSHINIKRAFTMVILGIFLFAGMMSVPVISNQVTNAYKRMLTIEALLGGDITAGGTLKRLTERGPRVIKKWKESPLTGLGFSNAFMEYGDVHVGNHSILLHSGIVGVFLLLLFLTVFFGKLLLLSWQLPPTHPHKKMFLLFAIFFVGWFFIHSSSGQLFSYYQYPTGGMIQALFFSFGALLYRDALKVESPTEPLQAVTFKYNSFSANGISALPKEQLN